MAASASVLDALRLLELGRYIDMAAGCLVIFDFLLVLDLEIKFMWKAKWSIMKVMYFINRYITFLDFMLVCIRQSITDTTYCQSLLRAEGVLLILGIYFAEYTFAMRTYVIWEKRKFFWIPICIFYVGTLIYLFTSYYSLLNQAQYYRLPPFTGCLPAFPPSSMWIASTILTTAYDAAMIILTALAVFETKRRTARVQTVQSDLFRVLYGEGLLFYMYMMAVSITSLVALKVADAYLFIFFGRCARSLLASRVILHIREMAHYRGKHPVLLENP